MRNVEVSLAAAKLNRGFQNDDCRCPIHVVVAIDENAFFARDGRVEPLDSGFHPCQQVG